MFKLKHIYSKFSRDFYAKCKKEESKSKICVERGVLRIPRGKYEASRMCKLSIQDAMGSAAGGGASQTSQQVTTLDQGAMRHNNASTISGLLSVNDPTSIAMMTMVMIT
jgi:hypothetical protein